jgi:hypothetical protein
MNKLRGKSYILCIKLRWILWKNKFCICEKSAMHNCGANETHACSAYLSRVFCERVNLRVSCDASNAHPATARAHTGPRSRVCAVRLRVISTRFANRTHRHVIVGVTRIFYARSSIFCPRISLLWNWTCSNLHNSHHCCRYSKHKNDLHLYNWKLCTRDLWIAIVRKNCSTTATLIANRSMNNGLPNGVQPTSSNAPSSMQQQS